MSNVILASSSSASVTTKYTSRSC